MFLTQAVLVVTLLLGAEFVFVLLSREWFMRCCFIFILILVLVSFVDSFYWGVANFFEYLFETAFSSSTF